MPIFEFNIGSISALVIGLLSAVFGLFLAGRFKKERNLAYWGIALGTMFASSLVLYHLALNYIIPWMEK